MEASNKILLESEYPVTAILHRLELEETDSHVIDNHLIFKMYSSYLCVGVCFARHFSDQTKSQREMGQMRKRWHLPIYTTGKYFRICSAIEKVSHRVMCKTNTLIYQNLEIQQWIHSKAREEIVRRFSL